MDTEILQHIGHSLYNTKRLKEWIRYVVFRSRCMLHSEQIGGLLDFFAATPLRRDMLRHTTSFVEQATRQFFYKNSTYDERISLVKGHVEFLESKLTEDALRRLYAEGEMLRLWEDSYEEKPLTLELWFHAGQRKEGCLSLVLMWDKEALYQIMFWLGPDQSLLRLPHQKPYFLRYPQCGGGIGLRKHLRRQQRRLLCHEPYPRGPQTENFTGCLLAGM